jgi:hypothetical protein
MGTKVDLSRSIFLLDEKSFQIGRYQLQEQEGPY